MIDKNHDKRYKEVSFTVMMIHCSKEHSVALKEEVTLKNTKKELKRARKGHSCTKRANLRVLL